jgi:hypothetical protein
MRFNKILPIMEGRSRAMMNVDDQHRYQRTPAVLLTVGTGGGVERMRGPCACPGRLLVWPAGQAQGPFPSPHPPLSLQDGDMRIPGLACQCSLSRPGVGRTASGPCTLIINHRLKQMFKRRLRISTQTHMRIRSLDDRAAWRHEPVKTL